MPQIRAPTAWQGGFTGKGTVVAIVDTGIDTGHPDDGHLGRGRGRDVRTAEWSRAAAGESRSRCTGRSRVTTSRSAPSTSTASRRVDYGFEFVNLDEPFSVTPDEGAGSTAVVRVPKGRYVLNAWTSTSDFTRGTAFSEPTVEIGQATEFTFDARAGRPVGFAVDRPDARMRSGVLTFARTRGGVATKRP